nr:Lrp/AsnC family transcriptional regulator [Rhodophyticola sp. CCM32]
MINIDEIDKRILRLMQSDATLPIREVAERAGISQAPCWRRINALKESGVIMRQVAVLDRHLLGFDLTAFVRVKLSELTQAKLEEFEVSAINLPEVQELQLISTENAYRLRVVVPSIAAYENFFRNKLGRLPYVEDVAAAFVVSEPKYAMELPI